MSSSTTAPRVSAIANDNPAILIVDDHRAHLDRPIGHLASSRLPCLRRSGHSCASKRLKTIIKLEAAEQAAERYSETIGNHLQIHQSGIAVSTFDIRQIAAVQPQGFSHLFLCPSLAFPQGANAVSEID